MSACSGGTAGQFAPSPSSQSAAAAAVSPHDRAVAHGDGATALPISSRAIPISSRAIPISSRAIPINFTTTPSNSPICGLPILGSLSCTAIRRMDVVPALNLLPSLIAGFQPLDLQIAYNVPSSGGSGQTIGIVVAYSDPNAASDLATYRSTFGLPACTVSSGCLTFVNGADGSTNLPAPDQTWSQEQSIDLDMASAICPNCKLLVSEASSADIESLTGAMQTAIAHGATVVSNSYTTPETATVAADNPKWNHPGVPIVAGAGDNGYGVGWPASSSYVTAVGGTTLVPILNGIAVLETAWSQTGSGCSAYVPKPSWQHDNLCKMRTVADVSAIANPVPGVAVYDTYFSLSSEVGWSVYGGTSVATPIVAGMYALAGNGRGISGASNLYANAGRFNNILLGANALCLNYLCTAGFGYNGPTGLGTPNGAGAF